MSNTEILYDFADETISAGCFIPVILAVLTAALLIREIFIKGSKGNKILYACGLLISLFVSVSVIGNWVLQSADFKAALRNDECSVVSGTVCDFSTPSALGHDTEHFTVDDVYFEYGQGGAVGYCETRALGGAVKGNGQQLIIHYVTVDGENIILKIEGSREETLKPTGE